MQQQQQQEQQHQQQQQHSQLQEQRTGLHPNIQQRSVSLSTLQPKVNPLLFYFKWHYF
jgi:hypothetical protein